MFSQLILGSLDFKLLAQRSTDKEKERLFGSPALVSLFRCELGIPKQADIQEINLDDKEVPLTTPLHGNYSVNYVHHRNISVTGKVARWNKAFSAVQLRLS